MASFGKTLTLEDGRTLHIDATETTHRCPPNGAGVTPCCGRTPFELPGSDRMTLEESWVTCGRSVVLYVSIGDPARPSAGYRTPPTYDGPPLKLNQSGQESNVQRILRESKESEAEGE